MRQEFGCLDLKPLAAGARWLETPMQLLFELEVIFGRDPAEEPQLQGLPVGGARLRRAISLAMPILIGEQRFSSPPRK